MVVENSYFTHTSAFELNLIYVVHTIVEASKIFDIEGTVLTFRAMAFQMLGLLILLILLILFGQE